MNIFNSIIFIIVTISFWLTSTCFGAANKTNEKTPIWYAFMSMLFGVAIGSMLLDLLTRLVG